MNKGHYRKAVKELRWLIAETFIRWALSVSPADEGQIELAEFLSVWVPRQMLRSKELNNE